ncbi:hypothetical protein [Clostridium thermarum]|uniref:hypothetical protein n=1 Tax=Clostridium thermarum TaxID=1716543 RepID=UPI0015D671DC
MTSLIKYGSVAASRPIVEVLGIACITNMARGIQKVKHSHERVEETAPKASKDLCNMVAGIIENL